MYGGGRRAHVNQPIQQREPNQHQQASQERAAGPEREGKEEEGAVDADLLLRLPATQEQQLQPQQPQPSPSLPDVADTQAQVQQGEGGVLLFQRPRGGVHGSGGTAAEEWRRLLLELRREEEGVGDGHAKGEDAMVGEDGGDGGGQELLQAPPLADDPPPQESQQPPSAGRRVVGPIARVVVRLLQREPADRMDSAAAAEAVEGIRRRYLEVGALRGWLGEGGGGACLELAGLGGFGLYDSSIARIGTFICLFSTWPRRRRRGRPGDSAAAARAPPVPPQEQAASRQASLDRGGSSGGSRQRHQHRRRLRTLGPSLPLPLARPPPPHQCSRWRRQLRPPQRQQLKTYTPWPNPASMPARRRP